MLCMAFRGTSGSIMSLPLSYAPAAGRPGGWSGLTADKHSDANRGAEFPGNVRNFTSWRSFAIGPAPLFDVGKSFL
jgi:hypothetical protein